MCMFCPAFDSDGSISCGTLDVTLGRIPEAVVIDCPEGTQLFHEGEEVVGIYCITSGRVGLFKTARSGARSLLAIARPGDLLGASDLLGKHTHSATSEALEDVTVCFIPDAQFKQLVAERPMIIVNVMRRVCEQLSDLDRQLEDAPDD